MLVMFLLFKNVKNFENIDDRSKKFSKFIVTLTYRVCYSCYLINVEINILVINNS